MLEKKYDIEYSTGVEWPHPSWVMPFCGGALKSFFLPGVWFGREFMELAQRMDVEYETVTVEKTWDLNKWGIADYYHIRGGIGDWRIAYQNLEDAMTSDEWFDVLVLPSVNGFGHFGQKTLEAIASRVERGAGLVLVKPFQGKDTGEVEILDRLSPLRALFNEGFAPSKFGGEGFPDIAFDKLMSDRWNSKPHYITNGIPFDAFPFDELAFYPYEARGEVIIESAGGMPIAAVSEYGHGRVAAFGWYPRDILPQHAAYRGDENFYDSAIDSMAGARHSLGYNHLEYFYGLVYRAMVWAARKEPKNQIHSVLPDEDGLSVAACASPTSQYSYRVGDAWGNVVHEGVASSPSLPLPGWLALGGRFRADVFLWEPCGISDWHTACLEYPAVSEVADISTGVSAVRAGETIEWSVTVRGSEGELTAEVVDDFDRVLHRERRALRDGPVFRFAWAARGIASLNILLRAEIRVDGHLISRRDTPRITVPPLKRGLDDFEMFMNSHNRGQGDLWGLALSRSLELGVTGTFPGSPRVLAMSGADGLGIYWYYRFPYVERKEAYLRTGDKSKLVRVPCLNDGAFWHEMEGRMLPLLEVNRRRNPVSYYANDEGSLTCYANELDLCFCPHCMEGMRAWLKTVYPDLAALNGSWGTGFTDWDSVVPHTFEEAEAAREFASWGDHRRFMELTFAGAYEKIASIVRGVDPEGIIRMSGCQATTPHTGYDYWLLHRHIGYFEAYGSGNQFELHRSFARPGTIIGAWLGYGAKGMAVKHNMWNAVLHGVTLISVFCEFCMLNPDFTFFSGALDMGDLAKELRRRGIGKLLLHTAWRDGLGVAVHYSVASHHGAYARGDYPRFNKARQGWLDALEGAGWQYDMAASQQIEAGELTSRGFKALILPYSVALSDGEVREILRFAEQGGMVIADMQTGIMDEHCKLYRDGRLDGLFGVQRLNHRTRPFYGDDCVTAADGFEYPALNEEKRLEQEVEVPIAEPGLRLAGGQAAFLDDFARKMPVIAVSHYGRGMGVYLNLTMDACAGNPEGSQFLRDTISRLLEMAGAQRPARLLTPLGEDICGGYEAVHYADGPARYTAVLRALGGSRVLYDGRTQGSAATSGEPDGFLLRLAAPAHVYDVRAGEYLGFTDEARVCIAAGDCGVYSMLPYTVDGITIACPDTAPRGGTVRIGVSVATTKPDGAYSNVLCVNLYDPKGDFQWIYSENMAVRGHEWSKEIVLPFNETTGEWKITVTDAASGVSASRHFTVK